MSFPRGCLEYCFHPNTVSKFIRFFPKFAAAFFLLHVIIILYSSLGSGKNQNTEQGTNIQALLPRDPSHGKINNSHDLLRLLSTNHTDKQNIKKTEKMTDLESNRVPKLKLQN